MFSVGLLLIAASPPPVDSINAHLTGDPLPRKWVAPAPPAGSPGPISIRFIVDATGHVTEAHAIEEGDPRAEAAAVAALRQWEFSPALDDGQAVPRCMDVDITFVLRPAQRKSLLPPYFLHPSPTVPPQALAEPDPDYPDQMLPRKLPGSVTLACQLDREGKLASEKIQAASDVGFVPAALATVHTWKFKPAMQGDLPVPGQIGAEFAFSPNTNSPAEILAANGLSAAEAGEMDPVPRLAEAPLPVLPCEDLLAGKPDEGAVTFLVTETGLTDEVKLEAASSPAFGDALVAAVGSWRFERRPSGLRLRLKWPPPPPSGDDEMTAAKAEASLIADLVAADKAGQLTPARGLDAPLRPLFRRPPAYPPALRDSGATGSATVDVVVCRDGRVRLVRVIQATDPAFGSAAAFALAQWYFQPPTHAGAPADVRVRIPVRFAP